MEEIYLFLSSNDSLDYYTGNNPASFTVRLPESANLEGNWACALRDFQCHPQTSSDLYVFCDVIQDSYVRDRKLPILQHIPRQENGGSVVQNYDTSICFRVTRPNLNSVSIYIKDATMKTPSFKAEPTTCTLHLYKRE